MDAEEVQQQRAVCAVLFANTLGNNTHINKHNNNYIVKRPARKSLKFLENFSG